MFSKGKDNMTDAYEAVKTIDVKNGWEGFKGTVTVEETKSSLIRAPIGAAFILGASFLYIAFCLIFVTSKYGPSAVQKTSLLIKEKSQSFNETVILPLKQKMRPLIKDAKDKVEQAIKDRTQTKSGEEGGASSQAQQSMSATGDMAKEPEDLESKLPEDES